MIRDRPSYILSTLFRALFIAFIFAVSLQCPALAQSSTPSKSPIKIGGIFSLSGWAAIAGSEESNGLKMAIDEINAGGGINGRKVDLVLEDTRSDFKTAPQAYQKLVRVDQAVAVIGPNWAEFTEVVAPLTGKARVPTITASGWKKGLIPAHPYLYSLLPPHTVAARPIAEAIINNGWKNVTVLVSENSFLISFADALVEQLPSSVRVNRISILPTTTDYRSILGREVRPPCDAVVALLEESGGLPAFLRQYQELRLQPIAIVSGLMYHADQAFILKLADGFRSIEFTYAGTPEFRKKYKKLTGISASGSAARGYDAAFVLKQAIENCGATSEQIQKCLPHTNVVGISGTIRFSPGGETLDDSPLSEILLVKDGKYYHVDKQLQAVSVFAPD